MRIIAIDPGYDRIGVAVLEKDISKKPQETVLFSTCITTNKKQTFYERMNFVHNEIMKIISDFQPENLIIEELFFSKNTKTALQVAEAKGIITSAAIINNIPITEVHPNHVKLAITGYGSATKADILFMLPKLISIENTKKLDDELDAIAIGITFFAQMKFL